MWYDLFATVYDPALEALYAPHRPAAVTALRLQTGDRVLDVPCGTGQSLPGLVEAVGGDGAVLGVDTSAGMLRRARRRAARAGWPNVHLRQARAAALDATLVADALGPGALDGVLCALGPTALPDWQATLGRLFSLLRPGGRLAVFDVYAPTRTLQTRAVELIARADLGREPWHVLNALGPDAERSVVSTDPQFGGELYVASVTRPG